jgi:hypothetical protein
MRSMLNPGGHARSASTIVLALAASALLFSGGLGGPSAATGSGLSLGAKLDGPGRVQPGHSYRFTVSGLRAHVTVRGVVVVPTAHRGGNCCGLFIRKRMTTDARGRARIQLRWPLHYVRCNGATNCRTYGWINRQRVDVQLDVAGAAPRTVVRIDCQPRIEGCVRPN